MFHRGQYNEMNTFRTRCLFFDPNDRSEHVQQDNERVRSNPATTRAMLAIF